MTLVTGVDSSTQSAKVEVRDSDTGALVASGHAAHPPTQPPVSEQDPRAWWDALETARAGAGHVGESAAISVAAQQHGLVVTDATGTPLRPAKLWNDTESALDARWLVGQLDGGDAAWAEACGSVPVAAFTITKLSWLHREEPEVFKRIERVMLPRDWLAWRLTGEYQTDRGDASGTGYWSPGADVYRFDLLRIVDGDRDWEAALPRVASAVDAIGTGDNMAAALGLGLAPGDVVISLGTSGTVFAVSDTPTADPAGAVAGFADATGRFLPLVCTLNATKVTDAIGRLLGADHTELEAMALAAPPGARGATLLPYFDGERTPNRPDARGALAGLTASATREDVARAAFEGVVCGLLDGLDALRAVDVPVRGRLYVIGGGARSAAYVQIVADLAQRAVTVVDETELVALGACVQAAARVTGAPIADVQAAWDLGHGSDIEPSIGLDAALEVLAAYATLRDP
ncbi:MAG: FGGY family carbohydrate kinase [Acidimicrobiia bacterium]